MSMEQQDNKRILHGNLAKAGPDENRVLPQDYRQSCQANRYDFESLPGSPKELKKACDQFKKESKREDD